MTAITISIPHQLGRAEAHRRIEAGFGKIVHLWPGAHAHAGSQRWDGDRLNFDVRVVGQTVAGVVDVGDTSVTMQIELPGILGLVAHSFRDRLQKAGRLLLAKD